METLWLFPALGAATGLLVVWMGAWLAFRPRQPKRFLGLTLQGFLPAHRAQWVEAIAEWVGREVSLRRSVERVLDDPQRREQLRKVVEARLRDYLVPLGEGSDGPLGRLLGEKLVGHLASAAGGAAARLLPPLLREVAEGMEAHVDLGALVRAKLAEFDDETLERAFAAQVGRSVRKLAALAAALGLVLGLACAAVAWLVR